MNDRGLLELAAKALGNAKIKWNGAIWCNCERMSRPDERGNSYPSEWNPLTNDGDALRLAADLKVRVVTTEECSADGSNRRGLATANEVTEPYAGNSIAKYAATRRAIVRAVAEIGKDIP